MKSTILKKIDSLSAAKLLFWFYAIIGLVIGVLYAILGSLIKAQAVAQGIVLNAADKVMYSYWAIIIFPIVYAIAGFLIVLITSWLYNILAKKIGGIRIEIE